MILFEAKNNGNLLEKENLLQIESLLNEVSEMTKWKQTCLATSV
jgi:hypothetical protein